MKGPLYTVVYMIVITAVFTAVVTTLNVVTADRIKLNETLAVNRQILLALDLTDDAKLDAFAVDELFKTRVSEFDWADHGTVYASVNEAEDVQAYAFPIGGPGFWGTIRGYLGVDPTGTTVVGIGFTKQSETPGLGARIEEGWFREQFKGKDIREMRNDLYIRIAPEGADPGAYGVSAITGATRTSMKLEGFLNQDIARIKDALASGVLRQMKKEAEE